ncbi:ATP-binding protein [Planctomycetota bacterium]
MARSTPSRIAFLYCCIGEPRKSWVETENILDECLRTIVHAPTLSITREGTWPVVLADKRRLADVFRHILENAVQFMDKPDGRIVLRSEEQDNHWQFSIADNGPGMDSRYVWKIFYIFYTLAPKDEHTGVGMGLALAQRIVEAHDGHIWAETHPGTGSTFFFTLPRIDPPTESPPEQDSAHLNHERAL